VKFNIAPDARPQVKTLLIATFVSIALWFVPFASYLVYPFKLFVTFIHESGHAIAAALTMSSVASLTVAPDTSGEVLSAPSSWLASLIISSAGYLGAILFGALLLLLIRRTVQARVVLAGTGIYIALVTTIFGLLLPLWNVTKINVFSMAFTVAAGFLIGSALLVTARYANAKTATFALAFLAVQCVLNAFYDLKTVFFFGFSEVHTDAVNMYNATGVPSIFWVLVWIGISVAVMSVVLRLYAVSKMRSAEQDLPFED